MTLIEFLANLPKGWKTTVECACVVGEKRWHRVSIEDEIGCEVGRQKMAGLDRGPYFDDGWAGWLERLPVPVS